MTQIHRAEDRGRGDHGWLTTRYSFSFADWFEPSRMGFGALRVINDDTIAAGAGFPPHAHKDMEIITIVMEGAVAHRDSAGGEGVTKAGDVQVMSAGTGVVHSEYNASKTDALALFQIWIQTKKPGAEPRYAQKAIPYGLMVAPIGSREEAAGALGIHQDAYITRGRSEEGKPFRYTLHDGSHGVYVFLISGTAQVADASLSARDAAAITGEGEIEVKGSADFLLIEVPLSA